MSGHVFHPGHAPLHGITVVVETSSQRTYVGRFDTQDEAGVHILDVGVHDSTGSGPGSKDEFIKKCARFGVPVHQKHVIVRTADVSRMTRLSELS
jgi:hypothetical protein